MLYPRDYIEEANIENYVTSILDSFDLEKRNLFYDWGWMIWWLLIADKNNLFDYACDSMESKMNKIKAQFGSSK